MATAQVLLQRFYCVKSMAEYQVKNVAMASIFLAAKMDEVPRRATDVINVFYRLNQIRRGESALIADWAAQSQTFWDMKQSLFATEKDMLKEMGFRMFVEHPHKFMLNYLRVLGLLQPHPVLAQKAWNYLNDRTTMCVRFKPEVIAAASIYLAARVLQIPLVESPEPWWQLFDATKDQLDEICYTITKLYDLPKLGPDGDLFVPGAEPKDQSSRSSESNGRDRPQSRSPQSRRRSGSPRRDRRSPSRSPSPRRSSDRSRRSRSPNSSRPRRIDSPQSDSRRYRREPYDRNRDGRHDRRDRRSDSRDYRDR